MFQRQMAHLDESILKDEKRSCVGRGSGQTIKSTFQKRACAIQIN